MMKSTFFIQMIGLDGSGKSTFLHSIRSDETDRGEEIVPTVGYSIERVKIPQVSGDIVVFDCSGIGRHRENWRIFYYDADGIIFVVDATDTKRILITEKILSEFLEDPLIKKRNIPIIIALNKQDDEENTVQSEELIKVLGLGKYKKNKLISIKETSGVSAIAVIECFEFLCNKALNLELKS